MELHQVGLEPEAGLAGAGTADDQHSLVACGLGGLGAAAHGKAFRLRQENIILKYRVYVWGNIFRRSP